MLYVKNNPVHLDSADGGPQKIVFKVYASTMFEPRFSEPGVGQVVKVIVKLPTFTKKICQCEISAIAKYININLIGASLLSSVECPHCVLACPA
jgi:hypothetical protein